MCFYSMQSPNKFELYTTLSHLITYSQGAFAIFIYNAKRRGKAITLTFSFKIMHISSAAISSQHISIITIDR